jgi:hypothetical protein
MRAHDSPPSEDLGVDTVGILAAVEVDAGEDVLSDDRLLFGIKSIKRDEIGLLA